MFCDSTTLKLGDTTVKIRRLTVAEIREAWGMLYGWAPATASGDCPTASGDCPTAGSPIPSSDLDRLLRSHVSLPSGEPIDPAELSMPQMRKLVTELVGIPEGSGISDFIGLLC